MKRFVVVGLGNFGRSAAQALYEQGHEVIALDTSEALVDEFAPRITRAAVGDGKNPETLEMVGARDADAAVVSTGDDIGESVLSVIALQDLGVQSIYVKVISVNHARIMEKMGVAETVFPEQEAGARLGKRIGSRWILNYAEITRGFSIQEMAVPLKWVGRSLRQLQIPREHGLTVVAVHDVMSDHIAAIPDPDKPLLDSDTLIVAGKEKDLEKVAGLK